MRILRRSRATFRTHSYSHDPSRPKSRKAIAEELGVPPERMLKAVIVYVDGNVAVAVVPVASEVDVDALARALGGRRARVAGLSDLRLLGQDAVSPLGLPLRVPTVVDAAGPPGATVYVASGRSGLELEVSWSDLVRLTRAVAAPIARAPS
ncbi:Cys-tRNA(Pro) deacylase [Bailinhaonella thermotolerans]|uniref:Cys-tRNA(Pro) deacylase n=2 Tax=Bailinhaonella thermotolerans TaxID=1070861 RepID=A0A3A4BTN8_9ACTN|nr:Cys-tRNA(Pro) deacylase [Bailinhaonella thermotolerans]